MMSALKIVFLCAYSARSSAYLQAIRAANVTIEAIVSYGPQAYTVNSERDLSVVQLNNIFCPDLAETLMQTIANFDCPTFHVEDTDIGNKVLEVQLKQLDPDIIIYSGYGGQIVPLSILSIAKILHIHSGWLPEYRGSTTLYHEIIEHQQCAASAIFLEQDIDTGPILSRKIYPLPPANIDVDYLYDNLIRADLLIETLNKLINNDVSPTAQSKHMPAYYIIHPLLKHLALAHIDNQES
jgi:methionyl-tRNA formyltransferase